MDVLSIATNWLGNAPDFAVPYALAALGLILSERAGVLSLGAEGLMLVGALAGIGAMLSFHEAAIALPLGAQLRGRHVAALRLLLDVLVELLVGDRDVFLVGDRLEQELAADLVGTGRAHLLLELVGHLHVALGLHAEHLTEALVLHLDRALDQRRRDRDLVLLDQLAQFDARVSAWFEALDAYEHAAVWTVTHAGVIRAATARALGVPLARCVRWPLEMGAIVRLRYDASGKQWLLAHWNA